MTGIEQAIQNAYDRAFDGSDPEKVCRDCGKNLSSTSGLLGVGPAAINADGTLSCLPCAWESR